MKRLLSRRLSQNLWPLHLGAQVIGGPGQGTLDRPAVYGPRTGQGWGIQRIACGRITVGTLEVRLDDPVNGELLDQFTTAGVAYYGKGQLFLTAGHRLCFNVSGGSGADVVFSISGVQMSADVIGSYLL